MYTDERIPLYEGEPMASVVKPAADEPPPEETRVRGHRSEARRAVSGARACFSPRVLAGKTEYVECPMINLSATGVALLFDSELKPGVVGLVMYPTFNFHPVRVEAVVIRSLPQSDGLFVVSLKFTRRLSRGEMRPARPSPSRELVPGVRPRKLRLPQAETGVE